MNRSILLNATLIASLLAGIGCSSETRILLCRDDSACGEDQTCERASGLCKPKAENPSFATGAAGAFDCTIPERREGGGIDPSARTTGLASVNIVSPVDDCEQPGMNMMMMGRRLEGLKTGCTIRSIGRPPSSGGQPIDIIQLEFQQVDASPTSPKTRLQVHFRPFEDTAQFPITLDATADVSVRYFERCIESGGAFNGDTELRLRAVSTQGTLEITSVEDGRFKGRFNFDLASLETEEAQDFGALCAPPRTCSQNAPCVDYELDTPLCASASCVPDRADPTVGYCGGTCDTSFDCGLGADKPQAYCLQIPPSGNNSNPRLREMSGRCILLCNPEDDRAACGEGTSCRDGSDFLEFFGTPGPSRCLDNCIRTPSKPEDTECLRTLPPPIDGGMRPPGDNGRPPMDGSSPPDGGRPPMDAGPPPDGGSPPDAGMMPPPDTGVAVDTGVPADTGVAPDSGAAGTPLGQACTSGSCPNGWQCVTVRPGSTSANGYCTRACTGPAGCTTGYTGPGRPVCGPPVRDIATNAPTATRVCGVDCGLQDMSGMCPGQMVCADLFNNSTAPMGAPDGNPDLCAEAP